METTVWHAMLSRVEASDEGALLYAAVREEENDG
jgi:hypothetical protein